MNPVEQLLHDILTGVLVEATAIAERMAALTDEELAEYEQVALNAFQAIRAGELEVEGDVLEIATRVADSVDAIRAEADVRLTAAADADAAMQALEDRLNPEASTEGEPGEGEGTETEGTEDEPAEGTEGAEGEPDPAAEPAEGAPAEGAQELEPVTAAAPARVVRPSIGRIAARRPAAAQPAPAASGGQRTRILAGAEIPGFAAGAEIPDMDRLADAFERRATALSKINVRSMTAALPMHVATIEAEYPEDQRLGDNAAENGDRIRRMTDRTAMQALSAAGGPCAPAAPIYDQLAISEDMRPVRDALPTFDARRGGIITVPSPIWTDYAAGVSTWTQQDDVDALDDEDVRKPCVRVDCDDPLTWITYALPMCVTVGNWFERSFPERLAAILQGVGSWQARYAERALLDQIDGIVDNPAIAGAVDSPADSVLGATRSTLMALLKKIASFRQRQRVSDAYRLELWLPRWFRQMVQADLAATLPIGNTQEENLAIAEARIDGFFQNLNVTVTWLWEGPTGSGQEFVGVNDDWPDRMIGYLFHPGALGLLDQGRIDLGIQRSPELNAANDMQMWAESFEGVFYQGLELQRLDLAVCPSGEVAGTTTIVDLVCPGS